MLAEAEDFFAEKVFKKSIRYFINVCHENMMHMLLSRYLLTRFLPGFSLHHHKYR